MQPNKQKLKENVTTIKNTIQLLVKHKLDGRSLTENEQWKLNHIFICIDNFSNTVEEEYDPLFNQTTPVPFIKRRKTTYLNWPEYQVIEKYMNILIHQINSNSCCIGATMESPTSLTNRNQIKWTTALFKLFRNYTYPLQKRYLEQKEIQRKINKKMKIVNLKKAELDKKYLEEKRKLEKEEHDIRMEFDPEYRKKHKQTQLEMFVTNYNVLRIMSGMGGLAYST